MFQIKPLEKAYRKQAIKLLTDVFIKEEPLTAHLGVNEEEFYPFARDLFDVCLEQSLSWQTVNGWGELMGIRLVTPAEKDFHYTAGNHKMKIIFSLLGDLSRGFEKMDLSKHLHAQVVAVSLAAQGRGIAKAMLEKSFTQGASLGFKFSMAEVTNYKNQDLLLKRPGTKVLNKIFLRDYIYQGEKVFSGIKSHDRSLLLECPLST